MTDFQLLTENAVIALEELSKHPDGITSRTLNKCCNVQGKLLPSSYLSRLIPDHVTILDRAGNNINYQINAQGKALLKYHLDNPSKRRYQLIPGSELKYKKRKKPADLPPVIPLQEDPEEFMDKTAKAAMNSLYPAIERNQILNRGLHMIIAKCEEIMEGDPSGAGDTDLDQRNDELLDHIELIYNGAMEVKG